MSKRSWLLSLLTLAGLWSISLPVAGQALLPHTVQPDFEQLEQQGQALAREAAQLTRFQRFDLALPRAELAVQLAPESFQAWFVLGTLYSREDAKMGQAIAALEKARTLEPQQPGILFALGSAYFQNGDYQRALQRLQAGLELEPDSASALFNLGNTYLRLERYDEAVTAYNEAFDLEEDFWPAINNIGLIEYERGNVDQAISNWEQALRIEGESPQSAEPQLAVAVALYVRGQQQQAIALAQSALRQDRRYADLEFLEENLWGEQLLSDTRELLAVPQMREFLAKLQVTEPEQEEQ